MNAESWAKGIFLACLTLLAIAVAIVAWRYTISLFPAPFQPTQLPTL